MQETCSKSCANSLETVHQSINISVTEGHPRLVLSPLREQREVELSIWRELKPQHTVGYSSKLAIPPEVQN